MELQPNANIREELPSDCFNKITVSQSKNTFLNTVKHREEQVGKRNYSLRSMQDTAVNDSAFGVRKLILIDFNDQYALIIIILFTTEIQNLNCSPEKKFHD